MFLCRISTGEAEWDRPENCMHVYLDAVFSAWLSSHAAGTRLLNRDPRNHRTRFARQHSGCLRRARTLRGSVNASTQRFLLRFLTSFFFNDSATTHNYTLSLPDAIVQAEA